MSKFQRTFSAVVQGQTSPHVIKSPLTVRFDVNRNVFASANTGHFTFYNLSTTARRDLFKDRFPFPDQLYMPAVFQAGYKSQPTVSTIFRGNVQAAWSRREGPNWITEMDCLDGGFGIINSQVSLTKPPGWSFTDAVRSLFSTMQKVGVGTISPLVVQNSRGITFVGSTWDELQRLIGQEGDLFIDNEVANVLDANSFVDNGDVPVIQPGTGLLNAPQKQGQLVTVDMLFEPRFVVGQRAFLNLPETSGYAFVNGTYKVVGIHHYGTISDMQGAEAITTLSLFMGYPGQALGTSVSALAGIG